MIMRFLLAILIALVFMADSYGSEISGSVSFYSVIANPERYEGKRIIITGVLSRGGGVGPNDGLLK